MKKLTLIFLNLLMCISLSACGENGRYNYEPNNGYDPSGEEITSQETEIQINYNEIIQNTSWTASGDGSCMMFTDDVNYFWYKDRDTTDDNYFAGTYQFYMGESAVEHITVDLSEYGVTEEELQSIFDGSDDYDLENFVCMTVEENSVIINGEEQLTESRMNSYFGFMLNDGTYLDIANMTTGTYYGFTKD